MKGLALPGAERGKYRRGVRESGGLAELTRAVICCMHAHLATAAAAPPRSMDLCKCRQLESRAESGRERERERERRVPPLLSPSSLNNAVDKIREERSYARYLYSRGVSPPRRPIDLSPLRSGLFVYPRVRGVCVGICVVLGSSSTGSSGARVCVCIGESREGEGEREKGRLATPGHYLLGGVLSFARM